MAMKARIRSAISRKPARRDEATGRACGAGRLQIPHLASLGLYHAMLASTGVSPPGLTLDHPARPMGLWRRDIARQGHAVGPLGNRRRAGRFRLGIFSRNDPSLSGVAHRRDDRSRQAHGNSRQSPRLGHGGHRGFRRGASAHACADLLHLGRFRASDRGARGRVRTRATLRPLPSYAKALRSLAHRPRHRPAVRGDECEGLRSHAAPQGFRDAAARRQPFAARRTGWPGDRLHRQDRRHLCPSRHRRGAQGQE